MIKLYNTEDYFVNNFKNYFSKLDYHLSLPKLNILSHFIPAIVNAENITTLDISKVFNSNNDILNIDSIKKKLWRFLNNPTFKGIELFNSFIKSVINDINVLKYTMPDIKSMLDAIIDGANNKFPNTVNSTIHQNPGTDMPQTFDAGKFREKLSLYVLKDIICAMMHDETEDLDGMIDQSIMKHIHDKGAFFAIRAKVNSSISFLIFDKKEGHKIYKNFTDLPIQKYHSLYYKDIPFGSFKFICNLAISRSITCPDDPYFILTNLEPNIAIRESKYACGGDANSNYYKGVVNHEFAHSIDYMNEKITGTSLSNNKYNNKQFKTYSDNYNRNKKQCNNDYCLRYSNTYTYGDSYNEFLADVLSYDSHNFKVNNELKNLNTQIKNTYLSNYNKNVNKFNQIKESFR